jgi:hypothetical protein
LEVAFEGHFPKEQVQLEQNLEDEASFQFDGIGFVVTGAANKMGQEDYTFEVEMSIDGELIETVKLPTRHQERRFYLFWRYQLPPGEHEVQLKLLNPTETAAVQLGYAIIYGDKPYRIDL